MSLLDNTRRMFEYAAESQVQLLIAIVESGVLNASRPTYLYRYQETKPYTDREFVKFLLVKGAGCEEEKVDYYLDRYYGDIK